MSARAAQAPGLVGVQVEHEPGPGVAHLFDGEDDAPRRLLAGQDAVPEVALGLGQDGLGRVGDGLEELRPLLGADLEVCDFDDHVFPEK